MTDHSPKQEWHCAGCHQPVQCFPEDWGIRVERSCACLGSVGIERVVPPAPTKMYPGPEEPPYD